MSQKLLVTVMHPKETATAPAPGHATSWPRDGPDRQYNNSSGIYLQNFIVVLDNYVII